MLKKNGAKETYPDSDQYSPQLTAVYFLPCSHFRALYANSNLAVTSQFLEGFCRKPNVVFPQLLIQIQLKCCYTFRLPAMAIARTFRKSYITVLK